MKQQPLLKKMKKITTLTIIITILLIGCTPTTKEEIRGTDGLTIKFRDDLPPGNKIYEEQALSMVLDLENKGKANATNIYSFLVIDQAVLKIESFNEEPDNTILLEDLEGSEKGTYGEKKTAIIKLTAQEIIAAEKQTTEIKAKTCYDYETKYKQNICIDGTIFAETPPIGKPCQYDDKISVSGGQGAPIAITKINTNMQPETQDTIKPLFEIYIKNEEKGSITEYETSEESCTIGVEKEQINMIKPEVSLNEESLSCKELKYLPEKAENIIRCEGNPISTKETQLKQLSIKLKYTYSQETSKKIDILKKT